MESKLNNSNKVSVIITTYNRANYIEEALWSIENQTYQNVEIIVVDDGSSNEIASEIKSICTKFPKCNYYWKNNSGQPSSRNYGINLSKGNFIAFCDDDDYWVLEKLEKQITILLLETNFDIITADIAYVNKKGQRLHKIKSHYGYNHGNIFENLLQKNRTSSVTPLLRIEVFEKTGLFNTKFTIAEDWDFWRRASYYHRFYSQNEIMAYVRLHGENMSYKNQNVYERIILYRKLSSELLIWGKNKLNSKDRNLIFYYEKLTYQKIISNNLNTKFKQVALISKIFINKPLDALHIIKLFFKKISK